MAGYLLGSDLMAGAGDVVVRQGGSMRSCDERESNCSSVWCRYRCVGRVGAGGRGMWWGSRAVVDGVPLFRPVVQRSGEGTSGVGIWEPCR